MLLCVFVQMERINKPLNKLQEVQAKQNTLGKHALLVFIGSLFSITQPAASVNIHLEKTSKRVFLRFRYSGFTI